MENRNKLYPIIATVLIMAAFFTIVYVVVPAFDEGTLDQRQLGLWAILITGVQLIFTVGIIALMKKDGSYPVLDRSRSRPSDLFRPILGWLFIAFKFVAIYIIFAFLPPGVIHVQPWGIVLALALAFSIGLFEEYLFRGFLFKNLVRGRDESAVIPAALLSSLMFGLFHIDFMMVLKGEGISLGQIGIVSFAFGVGFYLAAITYRFGKMWIPVTIHALIDFPTFLMIALVDTDKIFDLIAPLLEDMNLSIGDLGTEGGNPMIFIIGIIFLLAGFRILRRTISAQRQDRITREEIERQLYDTYGNDHFPDMENFQPRGLSDRDDWDNTDH